MKHPGQRFRPFHGSREQVSRTLRSAVTSGFVSGFLAFFYYRVLDRVLLGQGAAAAILLSNTVDLMVRAGGAPPPPPRKHQRQRENTMSTGKTPRTIPRTTYNAAPEAEKYDQNTLERA